MTQLKEIKEIKEIEIQKIRIIKWEDTTAFTMPISGGQVIKVYDGDSITIAAHLPIEKSPLFRFSVRLNGIDTPEIKGKNEDEKTAAQPVSAQTWICFLECSFIFLINADFPEPPGPVINILSPLIYLSNDNCCSFESSIDLLLLLNYLYYGFINQFFLL